MTSRPMSWLTYHRFSDFNQMASKAEWDLLYSFCLFCLATFPLFGKSDNIVLDLIKNESVAKEYLFVSTLALSNFSNQTFKDMAKAWENILTILLLIFNFLYDTLNSMVKMVLLYIACLSIALLVDEVASQEFGWLGNQINATMCYWSNPRGEAPLLSKFISIILIWK